LASPAAFCTEKGDNNVKAVLRKLKAKGGKFVFAYLMCAGIYALFEYIYMPWLTYRFGCWMFIPLYPSIVLANFTGVYVYDWLGEDVLFMEFGNNWINEEGGRLERLKKHLRNSRKNISIALSIWPSPIASYLFSRKEIGNRPANIFKSIVEGSIYCTAVWGGFLGLMWLAITYSAGIIK
jgi:hypothetical protein